MSGPCEFATPAEALREMIAAGAVFTVRHRHDGLGLSFSYRVVNGGDAQHCRDVLSAVKTRPPVFFQAFRAAVQDGAIDVVETTPIHPANEGVVETTPSASRRANAGRLIKVVATTLIAAEGDVETSAYRSVAEEGVSAPSITIEDVETSSTPKKIDGASAPSTRAVTKDVSTSLLVRTAAGGEGGHACPPSASVYRGAE